MTNANTDNIPTPTFATPEGVEEMLDKVNVEAETKKRAFYETNDPSLFRPMASPYWEGDKLNVRDEVKGDKDEWASFKADVKTRGVKTPIQVTSNSSARATGIKYLIVAGERRWTAVAELASEGVTHTDQGDLLVVPYIIDNVEGEEAFTLMAIENLHRRDLSTLEKAHIVKELTDQGKKAKEIAKQLNKTEVWVNGLRALVDEERTDESVRKALRDKKINQQEAINLSRQVPKEKQAEVLKDIMTNALTKGDQKRRLADHTNKGPGRPGKKQLMDVYEKLLEAKDEPPKGNITKADTLKLVTVMTEWTLGGKSDRTLKIALNKVFEDTIDTANLFKKPAPKSDD